MTIFSVSTQSNGGTLTMTPTSTAHIGSYTLKIVGTLPNPYSTVTATLSTSFVINVTPCEVSSVSISALNQ
jgi:hypothetical protein